MPLVTSPFNIYVRELGKVISNCVHGVKYAVVRKDGVMEWKSQTGLLYVDDVCLMANSEQDMKVIMEKLMNRLLNMARRLLRRSPRWCT